MNTEIMNRNSPFSYQCNACRRCCRNKKIQTNPYEILRLARGHGTSTGEFARQYIDTKGPYLRVNAAGDCVFLSEKGCDVYADRPLACRAYPLGRWVSGDREETFRELEPHPQTEGVYGHEGTIADFLEQQGANEYLDAADQYLMLYDRLFDAMQTVLPKDPTLADDTQTAMHTRDESDMPAFMEWLDIDSAVDRFCKNRGLSIPNKIEEIVNLHIHVIDQELEYLAGGNDEQGK